MKYNTWVVNLPQRTDRKERVLKYYPFKDIKIFKAIDGRTHTLTDKEETYFNEHFPKIKGAVGAFLSFFGAYKEIAVSPTEWNFLIGDDNVFHRDFNDIVGQMSIPEDAGMVSVTGTGWNSSGKLEDRAVSIQDAINRFKDKKEYNIIPLTIAETYGIAGFIHRDFAKDIVDTFESGFQTIDGKKLGTQVRQDATVGHLVNWWNFWKYSGKWSLYEFDSPLSYDTGMFEEIADSDISIYKKTMGKVYNKPK
tara:strand:+ start:103 stop:855 length:753 start_codon:yes stop_codon:yes gene_type:complete